MRGRRNSSIEECFWQRVKKTKTCWLWTGGKLVSGYGLLYFRGPNCILAHRISWKLHNGEIPKGKWILHRCDVPACVNPEHLFLGTHKENVADAIRKNRYAHGETSYAKITEKDARKIFQIRKKGKFLREIAPLFGIKIAQVSRILRGERWHHLNLSSTNSLIADGHKFLAIRKLKH